MSDKPTGVFVRLPLSEDQAQAMYDYVAGDISKEDAILAIGTPVAGGELFPIGYINEDAIGGLATGVYQSASIFREEDADHYDTVALVRQSEAKAQIAVRDAGIVRLRCALNAIHDDYHDLPEFMRLEAIIKTVELAMKGGAA